MKDAVIVSATRSPIGRAGKGSLRGMRPDDLAALMVDEALNNVPELDRTSIDDLYLGCGRPGGEQGFNMGRVVAVSLGMDSTPAATVTRYCASSIQTSRMAFHAIRAGEGEVFVSAGVECVSRLGAGSSDSLEGTKNPRFDEARRRSEKRSEGATESWVDPRTNSELPDIYIQMGQTAENVAHVCGISRAEQDEFALRSQHLAADSMASGFWKREITTVTLADGTVVDTDDGPRPNTTLDALAQLSPVFRPDGTVTAGNCCALNDGAAALVIMSAARASDLGITPRARIVATGVSALSPEMMGLGPVGATRNALNHARMSVDDLDLVEINEAFAAQVIPSYRQLGIDLDRVNVNGGGIAVGHPFGMTGARLTVTMLNTLETRDKETGLITMCVGGGQGMAMIVERCGA